ncbi:MAG: hypothetical protein B6242_09360 [Anaerolineaceae bacterium 4572_78]|nr:MAG: hypothetical protein B6242_09360 [Anaerolineaceae bacterium 4572_78]
MADKRILVVDDDNLILTLLKHSLRKLGKGYKIDLAKDGMEALEKLQQNPSDLIITDYMMPGLSGVDLMRAVRYMTPQTKVVLMTAHGTPELRTTVDHLEFDGYLDKPLNVAQIRTVVKHALGQFSVEELLKQEVKMPEDETISKYLTQLRQNTNATLVLLLKIDGKLVEIAGIKSETDAKTVASLIAASFLAAAELSTLIDNKDDFKSSYHEGDNQHIYTYQVTEKLLLAVVFSSKQKPGVIWFYTKQTAGELEKLIRKKNK